MGVRLGGYTRRPKEIVSLSLRIRVAILALIIAVYAGLGFAWLALDARSDKREPREYVKYYDLSDFGPAGEYRTLDEIEQLNAPAAASEPAAPTAEAASP